MDSLPISLEDEMPVSPGMELQPIFSNGVHSIAKPDSSFYKNIKHSYYNAVDHKFWHISEDWDVSGFILEYERLDFDREVPLPIKKFTNPDGAELLSILETLTDKGHSRSIAVFMITGTGVY